MVRVAHAFNSHDVGASPVRFEFFVVFHFLHDGFEFFVVAIGYVEDVGHLVMLHY